MTTNPEGRNADLFFAIADVVDSYPHLYAQSHWGVLDGRSIEKWFAHFEYNDMRLLNASDCGTKACLAGWTAALSGWHPTLLNVGDDTYLNWAQVAPLPLLASESALARPVSELAAELLGITDREADELFNVRPMSCSGHHRWTGDDLRAIGKGRSVLPPVGTTEQTATPTATGVEPLEAA